MSAPEEIVCETVAAYDAALKAHGITRSERGDPEPNSGYYTCRSVHIRYRPPPPRDEAREAWEKWAAPYGASIIPYGVAYDAFLAGRASVKGAE